MQQVIQDTIKESDNTFEILAYVSPIITGLIIGLITFKLTNKSKKMELLYQSKIPAFNELNIALTDYKKYLYGLIAEEEGNEYSPYYYDGTQSALECRTTISSIKDVNSIFLNEKSRKALDELIGNMAFLCNLDASRVLNQGDNDVSYINEYLRCIADVDKVIETLYKDLNLK